MATWCTWLLTKREVGSAQDMSDALMSTIIGLSASDEADMMGLHNTR